MRFQTTSIRKTLLFVTMVSVLILGLRPFIFPAHAISLPNRSVELSNPLVSATSTYKFSFDIASPDDIGSIRYQFCSDTPLIGTPCTPPTGLDLSAAVLSDQTGETGFSIMAGSKKSFDVLPSQMLQARAASRRTASSSLVSLR